MKLCGVIPLSNHKITTQKKSTKMDTQNGNTIETRATSIESGAISDSLGTCVMMSNLALDPMERFHGNARAAAWSFSELASQKKLVGTFKVDKSFTDGTKVFSFQHTFPNVLALHLRGMVDVFRIYSWKLHFSFSFRSNFQQVGQFILAQHHIPQTLIPYLTGLSQFYSEKKAQTVQFYREVTQLPHKKIPMGEDIDIDTELVWNCPMGGTFATRHGYDYDSTNGGDKAQLVPFEYAGYDMGSIFLIVSQQMDTATGVDDTMSVRVYSWLSDLKMGSYNPTDETL